MSSTKLFTTSLNVESYWSHTLVDLRDSLSISQIWDSTLMRNLKIAKRNFIKKQKKEDNDQRDLNDLREYVLLLGEVELPKGVVRDICLRAKDMIESVSTLDSPENAIPNCWTLPVVTLTSIAIALPSVGDDEKMQLLSSVRQGLPLARLVDDIQNAQLINVRKAAQKLTEIDLKGITHTSSRSSEKVLEELSRKAGAVVRDFKNRVQRCFELASKRCISEFNAENHSGDSAVA